LRPNGKRGPIAIGLDEALQYYDVRGRTWERQAMIKARPVAGALELGNRFLETLTPWIYHRFLSRADISGIKALKGKIEKRTRQEGGEHRNVKTGHGGIRDIEFTIQFLQLLNGGELPQIRTGNTLEALAQLEKTGCLSHQESELLTESYAFLRKIEHRLQIMFDLQTHLMPETPGELRKIAIRMGFEDSEATSALEAFESEYRDKTGTNRRILNHLLHDAFGEDDDEFSSEEVDLIFDPNPSEEMIHRVLSRYGFREIGSSYKLINELAEENIRYLSTRRCRHFLASIITELLPAIAATPDPDATLASLALVSESTGGKGVLWELFNENPPSLELFVRLGAYAPYLVEILCRDSGMIDSLMDSLVLNKLPTLEDLDQALDELTRGAEDIEPILHGFKNDQQLTVGVRDLLGKNDIREITGALSDIAQCCLKQVMIRQYDQLVRKYGRPLVEDKSDSGNVCPVAILSLGKFGGREMNYHSDLDVVFLYHSDGMTEGGERQGITNQLFYSQLAQNVLKQLNYFGPYGRLYEIDVRLRPMGKGGTLSVSLERFSHYFTDGTADLWERQTLTRGRTVFGEPSFRQAVEQRVHELAFGPTWQPEFARSIRHMRRRMREASPNDQLKRGRGGMVDVEFLVQMLLLRHGKDHPEIRSTNTLDALQRLRETNLLNSEDAEVLSVSYWLLRRLEGCLKLLNSASTNRLPQDPNELTRLAHLARFPTSGELLTEVDWARDATRRCFDRLFDQNDPTSE
jgi:glutamate-ammonia-ligase adenylyltransferase